MSDNILNFSIPFKKRREKIKKENLLKDIFNTYYDRVYRFFLYRTNKPDLSEDLTSIVFEKLVGNIEKYDVNTSIEPWIFTIARNTLYDHFRFNKDKVTVDIDDYENILISQSTVEGQLIDGENNRELFEALNHLDERERMIISYKFGAELKNTQIAKLLDLSETNVSTILYRSIKKLKTIMESDKNEKEW